MLYRLLHCVYIMILLCNTTSIIAAEKKDHYGIVKVYLQKYNTANKKTEVLSQGTGFFIDKTGTLATAGHNILNLEGAVKDNLFFVDPKTNTNIFITEIIAFDLKTDLALLKVEHYTPHTVYPIAQQQTYTLKNIFIAGFAQENFQVIHGKIIDTTNVGSFFVRANTQHNNIIIAGASGAPVFFENGDLAGVAVKAGIDISVIENLQNLLQENLSCVSDKCIKEEINQLTTEAINDKDVDAQYALGDMHYSYGDYGTAFLFYRLAALQGLAVAQHNIASMKQFAEGVPQSYREAVRWYELAALQGLVTAQYNLATIHYHGDGGIPQNFIKAAKWYEKAALQGDYESQIILSEMYAEGKGVPQSYFKALYWKEQAATQRNESVSWLDKIKLLWKSW